LVATQPMPTYYFLSNLKRAQQDSNLRPSD